MKIKNKKFLTSPSDLNNFVSCKYLIQNEIKFLYKEIKRNEESIDQKLWKEFGLKHENKHFKLLKEKHKKAISIKQDLKEEERYKKHIFKLKIEDHPKYFQSLINNLNSDQFGYDLFGLKHSTKRSIEDYYNAFKERYYGEYKLMVKNATGNNSTYTDI